MARLFILLSLLVLLFSQAPVKAAPAPLPPVARQSVQEAAALVPTCIAMVDQASDALSSGMSGLSPEEADLFRSIFDPADTGRLDDAFVTIVIENYDRIRQELSGGLRFSYQPNSDTCQLMRLFYTDMRSINICPYFNQETSENRKARGVIHEAAHLALRVVDRPYYDPKSYSTRYQKLTPTGHPAAQLPLIGPLIREVQHCDTQFHPDAYAWFAGQIYLMRMDGSYCQLPQ